MRKTQQCLVCPFWATVEFFLYSAQPQTQEQIISDQNSSWSHQVSFWPSWSWGPAPCQPGWWVTSSCWTRWRVCSCPPWGRSPGARPPWCGRWTPPGSWPSGERVWPEGAEWEEPPGGGAAGPENPIPPGPNLCPWGPEAGVHRGGVGPLDSCSVRALHLVDEDRSFFSFCFKIKSNAPRQYRTHSLKHTKTETCFLIRTSFLLNSGIKISWKSLQA